MKLYSNNKTISDFSSYFMDGTVFTLLVLQPLTCKMFEEYSIRFYKTFTVVDKYCCNVLHIDVDIRNVLQGFAWDFC